MKLPESTDINKHAMKLVGGKQPLYRSIYSLGLVELEMLKTYIKFHRKIGFIWSSKPPAYALIFFDEKFDKSLWLCIDNQGLNNLIIKNWYFLLLIGKSLNQLSCAKWFI